MGCGDAHGDAVAAIDEPDDERWRGCHADVWALADDSERASAVALLGKPVSLAESALARDVEVWARWQQEIATLASASETSSDFALRLQQWQQRNAEDEDIAASLYRTTLQADMAGQLFVRVVEAPETLPRGSRALDDSARPSFLSMPFQEALDAFLARGIISPEEFRQLSDDARQRAFGATRLASEGVVRRAHQLLQESLESGSTLSDFARGMREEEIALGVTPSDPAYLETIYRTNVASSYGAGRYRQIRSPAVVAARPFVEYRATLDSRTTEICSELHGKIFAQDDPSWLSLAPPNHFNCRAVTVARRDAGGKRVVSAADLSVRPAPGFDSAPAVELTPTAGASAESPPPATAPEPAAPEPARQAVPDAASDDFMRRLSPTQIQQLLGVDQTRAEGIAKAIANPRTRANAHETVRENVAQYEQRAGAGASPELQAVFNSVAPAPTRDVGPFHKTLQNERERISEVLTGRAVPEGWYAPVDAIEVTQYEGEPPRIQDGNHRLAAAIGAGAPEILVRFTFYDSEGEIVRQTEAVMPLSQVSR